MALFGRRDALQRSYDDVAAEYTRRIADELQHKPADRALLNRFAASLSGSGPCLDVGCGPGHVTRYLADRGVDIRGVDLSKGMVREARRLHPDLQFEREDMRSLKAKDHSLAAVVAFYSLIHVPEPELEAVLLEFRRVLEPGGALLVAFHSGGYSEHLSEWWDQPVDLDFYHHRVVSVLVHLQHTGFQEVSVYRRDPYPEVEAPTRRAYILAESLPGTPPIRRGSALKLS